MPPELEPGQASYPDQGGGHQLKAHARGLPARTKGNQSTVINVAPLDKLNQNSTSIITWIRAFFTFFQYAQVLREIWRFRDIFFGGGEHFWFLHCKSLQSQHNSIFECFCFFKGLFCFFPLRIAANKRPSQFWKNVFFSCWTCHLKVLSFKCPIVVLNFEGANSPKIDFRGFAPEIVWNRISQISIWFFTL